MLVWPFHPFPYLNIYLYFCFCVCVCFQEEAAVLLSAHSQAVNIRHPEADALPDPSHSENSKTSASPPLSLSVINSLWGSVTIFLFLLLFFLSCHHSSAVLHLKGVSHPLTHLVCCLFGLYWRSNATKYHRMNITIVGLLFLHNSE